MIKPVYISSMGGIWKVSPAQYKRLLAEIEETGAVADLDAYGKLVMTDPVDLSDLVDEATWAKENREDA